MNDGAKILCLQNTNRSIELLAAQRQLHADAKLLYLAYGVVAIVPPVIASVIADAPVLLLVSSVILPVVLGRVLTDLAGKRQCEAASVQQEFDSSVFGLSLPNTGHDESLAAQRCRHYAKKQGVSDLRGWYPQRIGSLRAGEAVYECQRVNICWTEDLAIMAFATDALITTIAVFIAVQGIRQSGGSSLAYVLLTPIIEWVVECGLDRWHLYSAVRGTHLSVKNLGGANEDSIRRTQNLIYEYRCLRPVPDFLYRLTKKREQWKAGHRL